MEYRWNGGRSLPGRLSRLHHHNSHPATPRLLHSVLPSYRLPTSPRHRSPNHHADQSLRPLRARLATGHNSSLSWPSPRPRQPLHRPTTRMIAAWACPALRSHHHRHPSRMIAAWACPALGNPSTDTRPPDRPALGNPSTDTRPSRSPRGLARNFRRPVRRSRPRAAVPSTGRPHTSASCRSGDGLLAQAGRGTRCRGQRPAPVGSQRRP